MKYTLTTLEVANLEESLHFYCELLEMPLIERFPGGPGVEIAMLGDRDSAHLELICKGSSSLPIEGAHTEHSNATAGFSIGFDVEDAEVLATKLDSQYRGPVSPNPTLRFFFVRDPDGYQVQLIEHIK